MPATSLARPTGRGWLRPHVSSVFAAVVVALVLGFLNVAGRGGIGEWHFGWPWEYATCKPFGGLDISADWHESFLWQRPGPFVVWEFARPWLVVDVLTCVALLVVAAAGLELWRRQRQRLWQIHLRELLLLSTVAAIAIGMWTKAVTEARRTATGIRKITFGKGGGVALEHGLPHVIREFVPGTNVKPFDRLVSANSGVAGGHFNEDDLQFLATQPHLRFVYAFGGTPPGSVAQLKACSRLETIWVRGHLADKDFLAMAEFGRLRELLILGFVLPPRAIEACGRMKQLETLHLRGRILGVKTKTGEVLDSFTAESRHDTDGAEWMDANLTLLRNMQCLERLNLSEMDLADDTLQSLADIKSLQRLRIDNCKFERADLDALMRTRPDLQIDN